VDYYYDTNPCDGNFSQNSWGRLTAVNFKVGAENQGCVYQYSYNQAGRVLQQKMTWLLGDFSDGSPGPQTFNLQAGYEWDNEGRMTSLTYPVVNATNGKKYTYQFDAMGRTNGMTDTTGGPGASAVYGLAGEVQSMGYFGFNEFRQYNPMYQMTRITATSGAATVMDMQYLYTTGQNNGRIAQSIDGVLGETVDYTYDVWNRLTVAQNESSGNSTNLALNRSARQSSTAIGTAPASNAVDGNTDGNFNDGSVTHTGFDANAWWEVDLGSAGTISNVTIWNRTDCCLDRLTDYWVFVSNTPFLDTDTPASLQNHPGTWSSHQTSSPNPSVTVGVGGFIGRYVRVQLSGTNYLHLAEVQVNGTAGWGQSFNYDGFGNLVSKLAIKGSVPTFSVNINPLTNGGPTSYPPQQVPTGYTDVEGRPIADGGPAGAAPTSYYYDHAGKRVMTRVDPNVWPNYPASSTFEIAMYGLGGQRLVTVGCSYGSDARPICGVTGNNVYFAGKLVVSKGVPVTTDRLGTVRANANSEQFAYYPYGEERTTTADGRDKFGTYWRDSPGTDYADQRYYNVGTGRFLTPDPLGMKGAKLKAPKSWNRYTYVQADPINFRDPHGALLDAPDGGCWWDEDDGSCSDDGGGGGGDQSCAENPFQAACGDEPDPSPGPGPAPDPRRDWCDPNDPTNANVLNFISNNQAAADAVSKATGLSSDLILAWAGMESTYGTSNAATKDNNFYGLTPALGKNPIHWAGSDPYSGCAVSPYDCFTSQAQGLGASATSALTSFGGKYLNAALAAQSASGSLAAIVQAIADAGFNSEYGPGVYGGKVKDAFDSIQHRKDCPK
jgi:RHS repeat-associated protein